MQRVPVPHHPFGLNNAASVAGIAPACLFETSEELHRAAVVRWRRRRRLTIAMIAFTLVVAGACVIIFVIL
jgi:hypothetical protein